MKLFQKKLRATNRGQVIIIIALAMVGLVAFVGMMTDGGILLIEYGKLKRGIDAAAIASAQQFRRGFNGADLAIVAENFLALNESDADQIIVFRCKDTEVDDGTVNDADLCTTPRRKLIRVQATRTITFGFLRVIGMNSTTITASSVGEAASLDLTLVIDTSSSMSYETGGLPGSPDNALDNPSVCNVSVSDPCQPLKNVKDVASDFIGTMFFPYDRVSIVALTSQNPGGSRDHITVLQLSDSETAVRNAIDGLKVYEPPACNWGSPASPPAGPCLNYTSGSFIGLDCPLLRNGADLIAGTADDVNDPSSCNSSNIGGALFRAAGEFTREPVRSDSFWVVIMLAGGPSNASDAATGFPYGYCPPATWTNPNPRCRDASASSRHGNGNADYDADDYARDRADFVADPVNGQGVTVFTIGLGNLIQNAPVGDPDAGEQLLRYIAEQAGGVTANHGFYSYAPTTSQLGAIFDSIAKNIVTRISK